MPATVAYVSISKGIDQIAEMLIKKLQAKEWKLSDIKL
jgi:hypothetical protein